MNRNDDGVLSLDPADIARDADSLGDRALGDPETEEGDAGYDEDGDAGVESALSRAYEMMDPEIGASILSKARHIPRRLGVGRFAHATARALLGRHRKHKAHAHAALARASMWQPRSSEAVMREAYINPSGPPGAPFVYVDTRGVSYDGGTISEKRRMRPAHADAVLAAALSGGLVPFRNFTFLNAGADMVLDIDFALSAVLPIASIFPWVGLGIYIGPRAFDAKLTFPLTVLHQLGAGVANQMSANFKTSSGVKGAALWLTNSGIFADEAAPRITPVTVAAVATGNFQSRISGLDNTVYTAVGRFLLPGDSSLAHIYRMLEASEQ
jgi:hypothetical protein